MVKINMEMPDKCSACPFLVIVSNAVICVPKRICISGLDVSKRQDFCPLVKDDGETV